MTLQEAKKTEKSYSDSEKIVNAFFDTVDHFKLNPLSQIFAINIIIKILRKNLGKTLYKDATSLVDKALAGLEKEGFITFKEEK